MALTDVTALRNRAARGQSEPVPLLARAGGLQPLVSLLDEIGASLPRMLRLADLPADLLDDPEALIPLHFSYRFVETCSSSQGIDHLGAYLAARTPSFDLPGLGPALRRATTVHDYLQIGSRLIGEMTTGERVWLTLEHDSVRFHHLCLGAPCAARSHVDTFVLVQTIQMLRAFVGKDWNPGDVRLLAGDATVAGDMAVFGDTQVRFGQPHSSFTMPLELLQLPIPVSLRDTRAAPDRPPIQPAMPQSLVGGVEALVASLVGTSGLSMETVAEALAMSTRSLQRELRRRGCSYSDIVQRIRIQRAREWLDRTCTPVVEISAALGYSDAANFTRAFRRVTGVSPRQYRHVH